MITKESSMNLLVCWVVVFVHGITATNNATIDDSDPTKRGEETIIHPHKRDLP
jgi:hypothetical protein